MLWVSGHTCYRASEKSFSFMATVSRNNCTDIYNPSWEGKEIWTNSLFLHKDRVDVRTWSHKEGKFLEKFDRSYKVPELAPKASSSSRGAFEHLNCKAGGSNWTTTPASGRSGACRCLRIRGSCRLRTAPAPMQTS